MNIHNSIQTKLENAFLPLHLEIVNESHRHAMKAQDSHFHITLVSTAFEGQGLLARHRAINKALADELAGPVHAITLNTLTPDEWAAKGGTVDASPKCRGASGQGMAA
ncbi:MAG: BolA/IbaG family iron-sulfur metabolism protein [Halothiobacillaceae bacterium]|nr:MAG: BolA/IbaG family iron-sulfur metabolism protein [Halothiobacillaceae bacterium]